MAHSVLAPPTSVNQENVADVPTDHFDGSLFPDDPGLCQVDGTRGTPVGLS